jgi:hypothetical protein
VYISLFRKPEEMFSNEALFECGKVLAPGVTSHLLRVQEIPQMFSGLPIFRKAVLSKTFYSCWMNVNMLLLNKIIVQFHNNKTGQSKTFFCYNQ